MVATSLRCTVSGSLDLRYVHRDGDIEEARGNINSSSDSLSSTTFVGGRASLRFDFELADRVRTVLELEHRPYDNGQNLTFGDDDVSLTLNEAYVEVEGEALTVRIGQFDVAYRIRPHGEPFLVDSDGESFFSGATSTFVRTTADRDREGNAGVRVQYFPAEIVLVEFAFLWRGKETPSPPSADDVMAILYLNALASERTALSVIAVLAAGPRHEDEVWTVGAGASSFLGPARELELFGEGYFQFGKIGPDVSKRAWAGEVGVRFARERDFWAEGALVYRSGDRDSDDRHDETFQSAERVERFMIVESAEFGMDWDTNMRAVEVGGGASLASQVSARLDVGWFAFNEDLVTSTGALRLDDSEDRIGIEFDGMVRYVMHAQAAFWVRAAYLADSDVIEELTSGESRGTWVAAVGVEGRF